ncbi:NAD(P)H-dependent oxidoreductase [Candidatus Sumerlaeota bacterium]|nr:NAD(P)H-dependent oxidoreductase [Candidatus Sumerlaeota bacterium]
MTDTNSQPPILIISCSLNTNSNSRRLALHCVKHMQESGATVELLDLRDYPLPLCDGGACYADPHVENIKRKIDVAKAVLICCPIYDFSVSAATKNLIELTTVAWNEKIAGFACAAGGHFAYMGVMGFANSLMLDFRCLIVPRFVYATRDDFEKNGLPSHAITERLTELADAVMRLAQQVHSD